MPKSFILSLKLFILSAVLVSCNEYELEGDEIQLFNIHQIGDSLNFLSMNTNKTIRYVIIDKKNEYHSTWSDFNGDRRFASVTYRALDTLDLFSQIKTDLIFITKTKSGSSIQLNFEGFCYAAPQLGQITKNEPLRVFNTLYDTYYVFESLSKNSFQKNWVVKIYWHEKFGIIKCVLNNGDVWLRKNIP